MMIKVHYTVYLRRETDCLFVVVEMHTILHWMRLFAGYIELGHDKEVGQACK